MDRLKLDWEDVAEVRSPRVNSIVYQDRTTAEGTLLIRGDKVIIGTPEGELRFPRSEIYSIVTGEDSELKHWDGKVTFGLSSQSGNVSQVTTNAQAAIKRRSTFSRLAFDYTGYYSEFDGVENANTHRGRAAWSLYVSRRWYWVPIALDVFSDKFQNIKYQITPSTGVGYAIVDTPSIEWEIGAGVGVRYTRFESVEVNEDDDDYTPSLLPLTHFNWDVTKKVEIDLLYQLEIAMPETRNTNQHFTATLSLDLIGDFDLDVTLQWDRVGNPERDSNGDFPEKDDFPHVGRDESGVLAGTRALPRPAPIAWRCPPNDDARSPFDANHRFSCPCCSPARWHQRPRLRSPARIRRGNSTATSRCCTPAHPTARARRPSRSSSASGSTRSAPCPWRTSIRSPPPSGTS